MRNEPETRLLHEREEAVIARDCVAMDVAEDSANAPQQESGNATQHHESENCVGSRQIHAYVAVLLSRRLPTVSDTHS